MTDADALARLCERLEEIEPMYHCDEPACMKAIDAERATILEAAATLRRLQATLATESQTSEALSALVKVLQKQRNDAEATLDTVTAEKRQLLDAAVNACASIVALGLGESTQAEREAFAKRESEALEAVLKQHARQATEPTP